MKPYIWKLLFIQTIFITVIFVIYGIYDELAGPAKAEALLKKLHIPLNYNIVLVIGLICLSAAILLYLFRDKFN